jgi:hypothetical protein
VGGKLAMSSTGYFWVMWLWSALSTMPEFVGNNWMGALFALVCAFLYEKRNLLQSPDFKNAVDWRDKGHVAGAFMLAHWRGTLKLWFYVALAFFIAHTLDLVRHNADSLATERISLETEVETNREACALNKQALLLAEAKQESRADTLSGQTVMQQGSIDNCQNQAIKLLTPPEQLTSLRLLPFEGDQYGPFRKYQLLAITNKTVDNVTFDINCQRDIVSISATLLPKDSPVFLSQPKKVSSNEYTANITNPAWTDAAPALLRLTIAGQGDANTMPCRITVSR